MEPWREVPLVGPQECTGGKLAAERWDSQKWPPAGSVGADDEVLQCPLISDPYEAAHSKKTARLTSLGTAPAG